MLMKTIRTTKQVPVNILSLKWNEPLKEGSRLSKLPCSACKKPIGNDRWGLAWAIDKKMKYAMRLCNKCGEEAERSLKG